MRIIGAIAGLALTIATTTTANAVNMPVGGRTSQPLGHWQLCRTLPEECRTRSRATTPVRLTGDVLRLLREVNDRFNTEVTPITDWDHHGVEERWSYPTTLGDCEDYVLAKRRELMRRGFRPSDLLITVVLQPNGEGHAVLSVRTSQGEFILDNIDPKVRHWTRTNYDYVKRQSVRHTGTWVSIRDNRARLAMR